MDFATGNGVDANDMSNHGWLAVESTLSPTNISASGQALIEAHNAHNETLAQAAHELKTPLAIIKGCATTLLGNSTRWDPGTQREMLLMIDTQADRLYDVLNTLLDVWRLDSGVQILRLAQAHLPELLYQLV